MGYTLGDGISNPVIQRPNFVEVVAVSVLAQNRIAAIMFFHHSPAFVVEVCRTVETPRHWLQPAAASGTNVISQPRDHESLFFQPVPPAGADCTAKRRRVAAFQARQRPGALTGLRFTSARQTFAAWKRQRLRCGGSAVLSVGAGHVVVLGRYTKAMPIGGLQYVILITRAARGMRFYKILSNITITMCLLHVEHFSGNIRIVPRGTF